VAVVAHLRCKECGHQLDVDVEWIHDSLPELSAFPVTRLRNALSARADRFVCVNCGAKAIAVEEPEHLKSKHKSKNDRLRGNGLGVIRRLLVSKPWLYNTELSIVESMQKQVQAGRELSDKQYATLLRIQEKVERRKIPPVFRG
jgi:hypothetical protein